MVEHGDWWGVALVVAASVVEKKTEDRKGRGQKGKDPELGSKGWRAVKNKNY